MLTLLNWLADLLIMTDYSDEFATVQKLAHVSAQDKNHPTFMFKAHLIRLLGNLAYKNFQNQNLVGCCNLMNATNTTNIPCAINYNTTQNL